MKRLFFRYQNMIPNVHFISELMEIVLKVAIMKFQEEIFMQNLGIGIGTNLAPILATYIYGNARRKYILYAHIKILFGLKCLKDSWVTDSGSLKATKNNFQRGLMNLTICEKIFF